MHFVKNRGEGAAKLLLYLTITTFIFLHADKMDGGTAIFYLGVSGAIWAVVWFIYVFVKDAVTAARWKKPAFPLPQHVQEDADLEIDWSNDPGDPSSPIYSGNIGLRSTSKR